MGLARHVRSDGRPGPSTSPVPARLGWPPASKGSQMTAPGTDFSDLRALYLNCTLKRSPEPSHTQVLIDRSRSVMESEGVTTDVLRVVDYDIPPGVYPDMTEYGWDHDD